MRREHLLPIREPTGGAEIPVCPRFTDRLLIGFTIVAALIAARFLMPRTPWISIEDIKVLAEGAVTDHEMELRLRINGVTANSEIAVYTQASGEFTDVFVSRKPVEQLADQLRPAAVRFVEDEVCITVPCQYPFEFRLNGEQRLGRWDVSESDCGG